MWWLILIKMWSAIIFHKIEKLSFFLLPFPPNPKTRHPPLLPSAASFSFGMFCISSLFFFFFQTINFFFFYPPPLAVTTASQSRCPSPLNLLIFALLACQNLCLSYILGFVLIGEFVGYFLLSQSIYWWKTGNVEVLL